MPLPRHPHGYRPSIRSLQEEFSRRISYAAMMRRRDEARGGPTKKLALTDNSEPFVRNPSKFSDLIHISDQVRQRKEISWLPGRTNS